MKKWLLFFTFLIFCTYYLRAFNDSDEQQTAQPTISAFEEEAGESGQKKVRQYSQGVTFQFFETTYKQTHAPAIKKDGPDKIKKRKKLIAALLAFPLPFGIIGLHRIYLGTKPYVPLVYIATIGGVGIIPFIDFVVICLEKDITHYYDNPNIIMWAK